MNTITRTIPAKDVIVLWNTSDMAPHHIEELVVCDFHNQPRSAHRLVNSYGACNAEWMKGRHWRATPQSHFLYLMTACGFPSKEATINALLQFAAIEGQSDWTSGLLYELGHNDPPRAA